MPAVALTADIVLNDIIKTEPGMEARDDQESGQQREMKGFLAPAYKSFVGE
jgi:hypothetical protein